MRYFTTRKYRLLFATLVMLTLFFPLLHRSATTRLVLDLLFSIVFLITTLLIFPSKPLRVLGVVLGVPTFIGLWTGYLIPGIPRVPLAVSFHILAALFFAYTTFVILYITRRESAVTAESIFAVFAGYFLIGLLFGHLATVVNLLQPEAYGGQGFVGRDADARHFLLTYFSFMTLTTVGYGDITPTTDVARGLAVFEAIVGQFYIAVLVAELISKRANQMTAGDDSSGLNGPS